jgi:hypothetical protein
LPDDSAQLIAKLRKEIDQIPLSQRQWILLQLAADEWNEYNQTYLVSHDELTQLCHSVGSKTLRSMVKCDARPVNAPRSADLPDDPDWNSSLWRFIFERARDLLTEQDADDVLAAGDPIIAAELRPSMASKWLREDFTRHSAEGDGWERANLLAALWRTVGPSETDFIVDHYFNDAPALRVYPTERVAFLEACDEHPRPEFRALIVRIIRDPRSKQTGPDSTGALVKIVNKWVPKPIGSDAELENLRGDEADKRTPEESAALARWHDRLRASAEIIEKAPAAR